MEYILENKEAKLVVSTTACQVMSFIKKDNSIEYMWQGDPKFWAGRNPTLFPHVSASKNKILTFKSKEYKVGNHGFARRSEFELIEQSKNSLTFRLKDNEETYNEYPYHFEMIMKYTLSGCEVTVDYSIKNLDEEVMPFGFGLHPAFNCPLTKDKKFEDYCVDLSNGEKYQLSYEKLKEVGTKIYKNISFDRASLTDGSHGVEMKFAGFRHFALWSAIAPFICLEPWMNQLENTKDYPMPFEEIDGIDKLKPQEEFKISYSYRIF